MVNTIALYVKNEIGKTFAEVKFPEKEIIVKKEMLLDTLEKQVKLK
ncbi:hypothetical protein JOC61_001554 [Marinitoga litoralis]|nr:hypothetical protein [Marinitoga litoralis]